MVTLRDLYYVLGKPCSKFVGIYEYDTKRGLPPLYGLKYHRFRWDRLINIFGFEDVQVHRLVSSVNSEGFIQDILFVTGITNKQIDEAYFAKGEN